MIYESIQAEDADEAKKIFESKFGFIPEICDTGGNYGYYLAKKERVLKTSGKLKRLSVTIPASNFRASGSNFSGKFEGWYVVAIGLQACSFISPNSKKPRHFTKDELLSLVFISPVDAAAKAIRPGNKKLEVVQSRYVEELRVID
jgi:hypothetical protein